MGEIPEEFLGRAAWCRQPETILKILPDDLCGTIGKGLGGHGFTLCRETGQGRTGNLLGTLDMPFAAKPPPPQHGHN